MEEPQYILSSTALGLIGGILGSITGALYWSIRQIIKSKNEQIKALEKDRDFYRDHVMGELEGSNLHATAQRGPATDDGGRPGASAARPEDPDRHE